MLISRAPVRISFAGGGTDLASYYGRHGGMVVSTTIDKFFYAFITAHRGASVQIMSSDYRTFYRHDGQAGAAWEGDLSLPRAILDHFGIHQGLTMFLASQVSPGTGLGSSSTVAVAITKAVSALLGMRLSKGEAAELASYIEITKLGMPIGKQDQYAASYGGLNAIVFEPDGVIVEPLRVGGEVLEALESNILLFFTGAAHDSAKILEEQNQKSQADAGVIEALHAIKMMAHDVRRCLEGGEPDRLGEILDAGWQQKKRLASGITTPWVDECYDAARRQGAIGGKITGAGGGGFLMLYCQNGRRGALTEALEGMGLRRMDFALDFEGARILVNNAIPLGAA